MPENKEEKLPEFLRPLFWDVDFEKLKMEDHSDFVLKRVVDRGDTRAWKWARQRFSLGQIKGLVASSRDLRRKTANFWALVFNLKAEEVPCLKKPYSRVPFEVSN